MFGVIGAGICNESQERGATFWYKNVNNIVLDLFSTLVKFKTFMHLWTSFKVKLYQILKNN